MPPLVVDQNEWFSAASSAPTRGRVAVNFVIAIGFAAFGVAVGVAALVLRTRAGTAQQQELRAV